MPTYKFKCDVCGKVFSKLMAFSDSEPECSKCGGPVQKVITGGAGVIYKGSGFYTTDYKKKR